MAIGTTGWELVVNIRDRGRGRTTRTFDLRQPDIAGDMSDLEVTAALFVTNFNAVSDCKIASYHIAKKFIDDAFTKPTVATAEVESHAEITGQINGLPNKTAVVDIPGPKDAIFLATDLDVVNTANTALITYLAQFDSVAGVFWISDGEAFDNTPAYIGKRTHSRSRKS